MRNVLYWFNIGSILHQYGCAIWGSVSILPRNLKITLCKEAGMVVSSPGQSCRVAE